MGKNNKFFIRGLHNLKPAEAGSVVTIGSFDGVHRGHKAILDHLREKSEEFQLPSVAVIFEPHPQEFFLGEQAPARLQRTREKVTALFDAGVDHVCCLRFNQYLCNLDPQAFIREVLVEGLAAKFLMIGDDFKFGRNREGDFTVLSAAGKHYGFDVEDSITLEHRGRRISSTWIRESLVNADFELVEALLGRPFSISGKVMHGQQLGRQMGFPTANVQLKRNRTPLAGVYTVNVSIEGQDVAALEGVANVGIRPTVGGLVKPILEVHLLDFSGDLYGQKIRVEFINKIRGEEKFSSLDELQKAIEQDVQEAKQFFSGE